MKQVRNNVTLVHLDFKFIAYLKCFSAFCSSYAVTMDACRAAWCVFRLPSVWRSVSWYSSLSEFRCLTCGSLLGWLLRCVCVLCVCVCVVFVCVCRGISARLLLNLGVLGKCVKIHHRVCLSVTQNVKNSDHLDATSCHNDTHTHTQTNRKICDAAGKWSRSHRLRLLLGRLSVSIRSL